MKPIVFLSLVLAATSLACPARAGDLEARKIDFTAPLIGLDKKPMMDCKAQDEKKVCIATGPITLGEIAAASLMVPEREASLNDQARAGVLALRVYDAKDVSLTSDEVTLIKTRVAKLGLPTIQVARVVEMLDPAALAQK